MKETPQKHYELKAAIFRRYGYAYRFAAALGIPGPTLSRYMNGSRLIPGGVRHRMAELLGVSERRLFRKARDGGRRDG